VAVTGLGGVTTAEVSLNEGRVTIELDSDNQVTIAEIRRVIRDQGFSPREASVTVTARVQARGEHVVAVVPGSGTTFTLVSEASREPSLRTVVGATATLEGRVEQDENGVTPTRLVVTRVGDGGG